MVSRLILFFRFNLFGSIFVLLLLTCPSLTIRRLNFDVDLQIAMFSKHDHSRHVVFLSEIKLKSQMDSFIRRKALTFFTSNTVCPIKKPFTNTRYFIRRTIGVYVLFRIVSSRYRPHGLVLVACLSLSRRIRYDIVTSYTLYIFGRTERNVSEARRR